MIYLVHYRGKPPTIRTSGDSRRAIQNANFQKRAHDGTQTFGILFVAVPLGEFDRQEMLLNGTYWNSVATEVIYMSCSSSQTYSTLFHTELLYPPLYYVFFPVGLPSQNIFEITIFDYFCNYHDGRGLGKKWCLFDHLGDRKRTTSIYKRDGGYAFYFKSQTKENLRGGTLRDRKNIEHIIDCFLQLGNLRALDKIFDSMSSW